MQKEIVEKINEVTAQNYWNTWMNINNEHKANIKSLKEKIDQGKLDGAELE